ncbi:MAG: MarR family transcriptional regulator [Capnocytophaga sp.]|nr:MarR family transcriptional regulator [Capnocytophaga sp.]
MKEAKDLKHFMELLDVVRDVRKGIRQYAIHKIKEQGVIDVTMEMLEILYALWKEDKVNQQVLVEKTNRSKASLTSLIDNLTARGLVQRNPDPTDRRNNLIALTEEGHAYRKKIVPLMTEAYSSFSGDISKEELETAIAVLQKINRKIIEL